MASLRPGTPTGPGPAPSPAGDTAMGTLERVVVVRADDYWASVAATLTPGLIPKAPRMLVLHAVSREHFEEVREQLARTTLYYPEPWELEGGDGVVLHDDMVVVQDGIDDAAIVAKVRSELAVARVEVIPTMDRQVGSDTEREREREMVEARTWVSLGGWCGPSLGLKRILGPGPRGPFDFALSGLEGVNRVVFGDGSGFVPPQPFDRSHVEWNRAEEVAERGVIGAEHFRLPDFVHIHEQFDSDADARDALGRRCARTGELLDADGDLFLLRAVTGRSWRAERDLLREMQHRLAERYPRREPHIIALLHSQYRGTVRLPPIAPGIDTWSVQGCVGSLVDTGLAYTRYEAEYARVILRVAHDDEGRLPGEPWPPPPDVRHHAITDNCEHWIF